MPTFDIDSIVPAGTARFQLDGVPITLDKLKPAALIGKHAGDSNPAFEAAEARAVAARRAQGLPVATNDVEVRVMYAGLFAKHVITEWENVESKDRPGEPLPFSAAKCEELLVLIARKRRDIFLEIFVFFRDADHFISANLGDPGELGK